MSKDIYSHLNSYWDVKIFTDFTYVDLDVDIAPLVLWSLFSR